jgi:hypothetical protein
MRHAALVAHGVSWLTEVFWKKIKDLFVVQTAVTCGFNLSFRIAARGFYSIQTSNS